MDKSTEAEQKKKPKAGARPVRESVAQKELVSVRHGATIDELAEEQTRDGSSLQERSAVRSVPGDVVSRTSAQLPASTGSHFAHDFSQVPTHTVAPHTVAPHAVIPHTVVLRNKQIVQPNLTVNAPDDQYEQEADQVADAVTRMPIPTVLPLWSGIDGLLDHAPTVGRLPTISRIQTRGDGTFEVSPEIERNVNQMQGGGQALPAEERSFFESRMGYDFGNVRIHTDANAARTSQALSARAFTVGHNIAFNEGAYQPRTDAGRRLLAHELTHVVQQGGAGVLRKPSLGQSQQTQVLRHLQALQKQPDFDVSLYRKQIAEFQRSHSPVQIMAKQQQLLRAQDGAEIRERDNSQTLRRCGGGGGEAAPADREPIQMRKVITGTLEGGKSLSDYYPDLVGTDTWDSDTTAGPFDNGTRAGSVVQLIGEIPDGAPHTEYTLKQTITVTKLKTDGTADALEGQTLDDIARSGRDQSTAPFRQVWDNNVSMCDPISGYAYNTLKTYEFAATATSSIEHQDGASKSVTWSVELEAANGTVTTNTVS